MNSMHAGSAAGPGKIPRFTIIIAVTHSLKCLEDCLNSLQCLDYPRDRFHVVLIDCQVLQGLNRFFQERLGRYAVPLSTVSLPALPGGRVSWLHEARLNEARNRAMEKVPACYFVFTEDDCTFAPDWLAKFDPVLEDEKLGAAGGPDVLPEGMGWLPRTLDCLLNSFFGTAGAKRGDGFRNEWYYPRKENTVIPAEVIERIGKFPEGMIFGAEMEMTGRIREAGLHIRYLPDNPVRHRRETTLLNLVRRNAYHAAEKVRVLRGQRAFMRSPHFIVFLAALIGLTLGFLSLFNTLARVVFPALLLLYMVLVLFTAVYSLLRTRSISVGLGMLLIMPAHHLSIMLGVLKGACAQPAAG